MCKRSTLNKVDIERFVYIDYAENVDTIKSFSGYVFTLISIVVCWKSNLQSMVTLFTIQAKYITLTKGVKEAMWLKGMIGKMDIV